MKTSIAAPPPLPPSATYWERSSDPWHPNAFSGIASVYGCFTTDQKNSQQASGWMAIDYAGNPIGFIADGSET